MENVLSGISGYITALGASVVLPVIITIIGVAFGQKLSRAFRSGVLIGIGFIGINLVLGLLTSTIGPAAQEMSKHLGVNLTVIDVGWPASAAIAFGSTVGSIIIPVGIIVNVLMLVTGMTRTLDIDLWNYWHFALVGALVAIVTGNFWLGIAAAVVDIIIVLALADLSAPMVQKYFDFPDVSFPHGTSAPYVIFALPLNWIFDRIPGFNRLKADPEAVQKRFGIFGESMIFGLILGLIIGLAGYGLAQPRDDSIKILTLAISLAAAMLLLPRMVSLLMEGLIPISDSARDMVSRRFPGRRVYIGMDTALAIGQPAVLAASLVLIPLTVLLAIALAPLGNRTLPLVDLASIPFIIALMVPIFRGNIIRSVIGGIIVIGGGLFISTALAPQFTEIAVHSGFKNTTGGQISSLIDGANPLTGLFFGASYLGGWTIGVLAALAIAFAFVVRRIVRRRERDDGAGSGFDSGEDADDLRQPTEQHSAGSSSTTTTVIDAPSPDDRRSIGELPDEA